MEGRKALKSLDNLLNILSAKLPYQLKIVRVRGFPGELDRFRVYASRYVGRVTEQLYRDVREMINEVFNFSEVVEIKV